MATSNPVSHLCGLAKRLVSDGLLAEDLANEVQEKALKEREPFVSYLVSNNLLDSVSIASSACQEFGIPLFDLSAMDLDSAPVSLVDEKLIRQHRSLPLFKRGNRLFVAVSDPTNLQALDEIKFHTGISTETILVEEDKLSKAIDQVLDTADTSMSDLLDEDLDNLDIEGGDDVDAANDSMDADIDDTPVVRFVNKVLLDAINKGASDIHIEPYEHEFRIRFRQDGVLHEVANPPISMATRLISRIKVMSKMDIAERRVPQDGRIKMKISKKRAIDFRVSSCPTLFGEKIVMRILDPTSAQLGIDALGYEDDQKELYMKALNSPYMHRMQAENPIWIV
ncbi:Type IV fimbrial assembly, ATPase PilB, partial [hydrothermal vent metagenome]